MKIFKFRLTVNKIELIAFRINHTILKLCLRIKRQDRNLQQINIVLNKTINANPSH